MTFRIFISYSQGDFRTRGRIVHNYLSQMFPDDDIYIDQSKPKGKKWRNENDKKLKDCDLVVLIITPSALRSNEVKREMKIVNELKKRILPCKIVDLKKRWNELPWNLGEREGIDFEDDEVLRTKLFGAITEIRNEFLKKTPRTSISQSEPIIVATDKPSYLEGETIVITGEVKELLSNVPVTLQVIAANGHLVTVQQLEVGADKKFSTNFTTGGAVMKSKGTYAIKVQYGTSSRTAESTFEFGGYSGKITSTPSKTSVSVEGTNVVIDYKIRGGKIIGAIRDAGASSIIVAIETVENGEFTTTLPRELLDARIENEDIDFFVLVDGEEKDFEETKTPSHRKLTISFPKDTKEIEIIGTPNINKRQLLPLFKTLKKIERNENQNKIKVHTISVTSSFDRTVYPLDSVVYVRALLNDIIMGKPIIFEVYDSNGKLLISKEIDPLTYDNLELKSAGIYETSFKMKGNDWKIGETYTVKAKHGSAEAEDTCLIDERTPVIMTDKSVYTWLSDIILTVIDPDADKDSKKIEYVGNRPDSKLTLSSSKGKITNYKLRETGNSTGIFQGIVGLIGVFKNGAVKGYRLGKKTITKSQGTGIDDGFIRVTKGDELIFTYTNRSKTETLAAFITDFGATVELDQKKYTWTDKVFITVVAPDFNFNSKKIDIIGNKLESQITISTSKGKITNYKLKETGKDTGIFTGEVTLTGFPFHNFQDQKIKNRMGITKGTGPNNGFIATSNDDFIEIAFNYYGEEVIVGRAKVGWNIGEIQWLEATYPPEGTGIVRVIDPDMNINPGKIDGLKIHIWSDSDPKGIDFIIYETGEGTGIFEGKITFNKYTSSSDGRLKVSEGDTISAKYIDQTLPPPYSINSELEITSTATIQRKNFLRRS